MIDYVGYYYFQRSDSIMGERYSLKRLDAVEAAEDRCAYLAEHFPELMTEAQLRLVGTCIYHGQMALRFLPAKEQKYAFSVLDRIKREHPLRRDMYKEMKFTHRLWFDMAKFSLPLVCRVRNILGVGI